MLLIIEALLLISAALGKDHRAAAVEGEKYPLDMALNSVDDRYEKCTKQMANLVENKYLKQEKSNPETGFGNAWKLAEKNHKPPGENLKENHLIAIYVYTNSKKSDVYKKFNAADRKEKKEYENKTYKWYSLHFLLTDAIQILKKTQNTCYDTYRRTDIEFDNVYPNKEVRFGSFTSSSKNSKSTSGYGSKSCFEIHTCQGADITNYSMIPEEEEVLIPPYEMFEVTAIKRKTNKPKLWCETVYVLKSIGTKSDLNCALVKKPTNTIRLKFK
ncbi:GPI-linked NAD(P)(+)--arginine ADP-ribosyltransferase 1-like [Carassius gibelio]|uniref:GPI-linked NAD(P)(+)--arginine ADP-ribosyltransferase 1-like n=1 Tax=Carassius gibelio TaxID=101364 RepID=UPI0022790FA1|nr:GPI-linked NAD(P)(+)--arginine ADP-ribosyltransferase 1-like [Carassius gibelio]